MKSLRIITIVCLLSCGSNIYGGGPISPSGCGYVKNFLLSTLVWKINIPITWTSYSSDHEVFRGSVCGKGWYPEYLNFRDIHLKIGFFLCEFRPLELLISGFLFLNKSGPFAKNGFQYLRKLAKQNIYHRFYWHSILFLNFFLPIRCHLFSVKYWFVRMGWFNPGTLISGLFNILSSIKPIKRGDMSPFFFVTNDYCSVIHKSYIFFIFVLVPYISIDLSWFENYGEETFNSFDQEFNGDIKE